ncbi:hypothetical protein KGV55_00195 [Candidatus Gracilibacteria bacterium]|nr:hypothetical protein [Candidatus Gracilibacteria bacterium]MBS9783752.1 hypothetical protein [Candidatus Gracilibacteria bacterium]
MIIKLIGSGKELETLEGLVQKSLVELALDDAVKVEKTDDEAYKMEVGVTQNPALAIEEESIDFKDMIFEGEIPEYEEIKSMFLSILGDEEGDMMGCASGSCDGCAGGCE